MEMACKTVCSCLWGGSEESFRGKCVLLPSENGDCSIAGTATVREESPGNAEPPYFLTGRGSIRKGIVTASATENIPPTHVGKGENARQELTTGAAMCLMVNLMG